MNAVIICAQNNYIDRRPPGLRVQIGDSGDLEKDSLLATNINILKSCGYSEIHVILNCKFRAIYRNEAIPLFVNGYYGICDALYRFKKYINDTLILDGRYLTNKNIVNELKSKNKDNNLIYPVSNGEMDFLGIYRAQHSLSNILQEYHDTYFNGKEYNFSESDLDHNFELKDLFLSESINKIHYKSSFKQELYK